MGARLERRHLPHRGPQRLTADGVVVAVAAEVVADRRAQTVLHQL